MTSPRQRAANRANALKSTGPKTHQGRVRASLNATKHGLTQPIDASPWGNHLREIADLLITDGLTLPDALDLAKKILELERNLDYQRKRFEQARETVSIDAPRDDIDEGEAGTDPNLLGEPGNLAGLLSDTLGEFVGDLWVADTLEKRARAKKPIFEEKLDLEISKFFRKTVEMKLAEARRAELQKLRAADRHLRRSALQLSKAIKATDEATDIYS
jgi:hypothetical protein